MRKSQVRHLRRVSGKGSCFCHSQDCKRNEFTQGDSPFQWGFVLYRNRFLGIAFLVTVFLGQEGVFSQEYSVPPADFWSLNDAERKQLIKVAYEQRLRLAGNLRFKAIQRFGNAAINELMVDPEDLAQQELSYANTRTFFMSSMDGSYKLLASKTHALQTDLKQEVVSVFDVGEGVHRGTVQTSEADVPAKGLIDNAQDIVDKTNRMLYWFYPEHTELGDSIIKHLVDQITEGVVRKSADSDLVEVVVPWGDPGEPNPIGSRVLWLDSADDFVFVKGVGAKIDRNSGERYLFHAFGVTETEQVGGISVPVKLREAISNDFREPDGKAAIYDLSVMSIEHGAVTAEDLAFEFPEGTTVVDKIRGMSFVAGRNGSKGSVESLLGGPVLVPAVSRSEGSGWRFWLLVFNIGIAFIAIGYLATKRGGSKDPAS